MYKYLQKLGISTYPQGLKAARIAHYPSAKAIRPVQGLFLSPVVSATTMPLAPSMPLKTSLLRP